MSEPKEHKQDAGDLVPSEASTATKGCMLGVIFIILLIIAAVITAIIVVALNLFSDENSFGDFDFDFSFMDDITGIFESDTESDTTDTSDGDSITQEIGGLRITLNDAYFNENDEEQYIVDVNIESIDREYYTPSATAFHIETENGNAYAYTDESREVNDRESGTGEFNQMLEVGTEARYLLAFHVSEYLDFDVDKTLVFRDYREDDEISFDLN